MSVSTGVSMRRRSKISMGVVGFGAVLVVASLASGPPVAAANTDGTFDLQPFDLSSISQGSDCQNGDGWGFSTGGKFRSITLNEATSVPPITGLSGNQASYFVPLPSGVTLDMLSATGSSALINYNDNFAAPTFELAYVCGDPSPTTTVPPSTVPPTDPPSTTDPSTSNPSTSNPSTTPPSTEIVTTTVDVRSQGPTSLVGASDESSTTDAAAGQLAETGSRDRLVVVFGLLLVAMGSVFYLVSRPTLTD